ncbi:MAG: ATP-binding protein, partial [Natronospirillum sp.]
LPRLINLHTGVMMSACVWTLLLFLGLPTPAQALITLNEEKHRYDLHDLDGGHWLPSWEPQLNLTEPASRPHKPVPGPPNSGWSAEVFHWHGVLVNESQYQNWYLVIRNPSIDLLRVYLGTDDPQQVIQLSDYQAPGQQLFPGNHFVIPIVIEPGQRQPLYITATSEDWQFYPMMLVNQTGYQTFAHQEMLVIGATTGLLLALFLFNLVQTLLKGHWSFVWVAISAIAWAVQLWFWFGLGYLWLWPHSPWLQNHIWYLLIPITGVSILASVIAALSGYLDERRRWRLYAIAVSGFLALLPLHLVLSNGVYLMTTWLWFTSTTLLIVYYFRPTSQLWSAQLLLLGYSLLSGAFFLYLGFATVLHNAVLIVLGLGYLTLTGMHSFVVYWQYHRNQKKLWQDLKERSRTLEHAADTRLEQLDQYRSAAQLSRTWRSTFTRNIAQRFEVIARAVVTLRQTVKAEERQAALEDVKRASQDGLTYVEDLVSLERLLTRDYAIESTSFDLATWLEQFDEWFERNQTGHSVFFRVELQTSDLPHFLGPAEALKTILQRLLDNALQYTDSGFVKLLAEAEGQTRQRTHCRFEVRDSGRGLSAEQVKQIQRFWNTSSPAPAEIHEETHQLGSGLTIALFLLRQLGARFQVQSTPEAGTSMCFWLWLDRDQSTQTNAAVEHWLIVDDEPFLYEEARQQLDDGVDVHWVRNGRIALSSLRETQFDVIIIGLETPLVDGIEFTRLCRVRDDTNRFAWIIGTHKAPNERAARHAEQAGMN